MARQRDDLSANIIKSICSYNLCFLFLFFICFYLCFSSINIVALTVSCMFGEHHHLTLIIYARWIPKPTQWNWLNTKGHRKYYIWIFNTSQCVCECMCVWEYVCVCVNVLMLLPMSLSLPVSIHPACLVSIQFIDIDWCFLSRYTKPNQICSSVSFRNAFDWCLTWMCCLLDLPQCISIAPCIGSTVNKGERFFF